MCSSPPQVDAVVARGKGWGMGGGVGEEMSHLMLIMVYLQYIHKLKLWLLVCD